MMKLKNKNFWEPKSPLSFSDSKAWSVHLLFEKQNVKVKWVFLLEGPFQVLQKPMPLKNCIRQHNSNDLIRLPTE